MFYEPDDIHYVDGRLRGTVVRDKENNPILVKAVEITADRNFIVIVEKIKQLIEDAIPLDEIKLDSPTLGYTNYDGTAWYLGRYPKRRDWKQGLRRDNMFSIKAIGRVYNYNFRDYVPLVVPFKNKYPTFRESLDRVEDIYDSCAFHPLFAVNKDKEILYKNKETIAKVKDGEPKLHEDFFWLAEGLNEAIARG